MNRYPVMGGTSIAFSPLDYSNFVIGTEAGGVLKCTMGFNKNRKIRSSAASKKTIKSGEFEWTPEAYSLIENVDFKHR